MDSDIKLTLPADFYPRPPRGGRLQDVDNDRGLLQISIHALREEGDEGQLKMLVGHSKFLSTPSARRATGCHRLLPEGWRISIHALREEGDYHQGSKKSTLWRFLSTPSARRAT